MSTKLRTIALIALSFTAVACGSDDEEPGTMLAASTGAWTVYADPFGNDMPNPAMGITGQARAFKLGAARMRIELDVAGLPAGRTFGSHLHQRACDDMKAGGHYQHTMAPTSPTDPSYANASNEAWLDFTTDGSGAGQARATVDWLPRPGEAKAIIVHAERTGDGGVAGARLACLSLPF